MDARHKDIAKMYIFKYHCKTTLPTLRRTSLTKPIASVPHVTKKVKAVASLTLTSLMLGAAIFKQGQ